MVVKNYMLSALCILLMGLFCWNSWGTTICLLFLASVFLYLLLLSGSPLGELLILHFIFRARPMPSSAAMAPAVQTYLESCKSQGKLSPKKHTAYYADSETRYFMPLSKRRVVISLALQDELIESGPVILFRGVPPESYIPAVMLSRRVLLLLILGIFLILWIAEKLAILTALFIKAICTLVMLLVTGAIFYGLHAIWNAIALGRALGSLITKIQDLFQPLEDRLIEWLMRFTATCSFQSLQNDSVVVPDRS